MFCICASAYKNYRKHLIEKRLICSLDCEIGFAQVPLFFIIIIPGKGFKGLSSPHEIVKYLWFFQSAKDEFLTELQSILGKFVKNSFPRGIIHLVRTQNFLEIRVRMRGKKCCFFEKTWVRTK